MEAHDANVRTVHISVCICSYKRIDLLQKLLGKLSEQQTEGLFSFSAIVADNDSLKSAEKVVASYSNHPNLSVIYCDEPRQNIALARNKAIQNAQGDLIAFIDDDEFPTNVWLLELFKTYTALGVSGVLGPVLPHFENDPPAWVRRGRFFDRPTHPTGFKMGWNECRTGNVLFDRKILNELDIPFRSQFDTAGEDVDFFRRTIENGCNFVWCNEAVVYELVPSARCSRRYLLNRALLRGSNFSKHPTERLKNGLKSLIAVPFYAFSLPFLALLGQHLFLKYLIKLLEHTSRLFSYVGLRLVTERQT